MKNRITLIAACLVAIAGTGAIVNASAQSNVLTPVISAQREKNHPELAKALRKIKSARADLASAAHDYSGHRTKAVEACDLAINEIQAAYKANP